VHTFNVSQSKLLWLWGTYDILISWIYDLQDYMDTYDKLYGHLWTIWITTFMIRKDLWYYCKLNFWLLGLYLDILWLIGLLTCFVTCYVITCLLLLTFWVVMYCRFQWYLKDGFATSHELHKLPQFWNGPLHSSC
jgi:hypothetical protein